MILNLKDITFYVINKKNEYEHRAIMTQILERLELNFEFIPGVDCEPGIVAQSLSRLKILEQENFHLPFAILSDDCIFREPLQLEYELPEHVDALYLGQSRFGIEKMGEFGWGEFNNIHFESYNENYIRLLNNLAGHAIVYISQRYRQQAIEANLNALMSKAEPYPGAIEYAMLQKDFLVLTPISNPCYQSEDRGGNQVATHDPLFTVAKTENLTNLIGFNQPNDFEILTKDNNKFYLFYDLFIHWNLMKITAVAPHYGEDVDMTAYHQDITLIVGELKIKGNYIPCALDSWEPSILIDFEHPDLARILQLDFSINVIIKCGGLSKKFYLEKYVPRYDVSMSVIIKNENRWIDYYLDYYLNVLSVDHVYIYDNLTQNKDQLQEIVKPYIAKSQATLIPWNYRWRNHKDKKQIGQPPQETHTLNKYGHGNWIGFFDVDEFLKIPGKDLQEFMSDYNPRIVGGVSFSLRWFFYKGPKTFEQIGNPLEEYVHCKKDELGRKRQKLLVSPKLARYAGFHWIPKGLKEVQIDDEYIYFHHYYFRQQRFMEGKRSAGIVDRSMQDLYKGRAKAVQLESFIDECLLKAKKGESKLGEEFLDQKGASGTRSRHFYNNLGSKMSHKILSVGNYNATILDSLLEKHFFHLTCIYDLQKDKIGETEFLENLRKYAGATRIKMLNQDWKVTEDRDLDKYNIFIYHGDSSHSAQYAAMMKFVPHLENYFLLIIENWNKASVRKATRAAFNDLNKTIFFNRKIILTEEDVLRSPFHNGRKTWWNGIGIFGLAERVGEPVMA